MHPLTEALIQDLRRLADPAKAGPMQAYMKTDQPFYGVQAGPRRRSFKTIVKRFKEMSRAEYEQVIFELWQGNHREAMYQALEVAQHFKAYRDPASWPIYERLVRSATNWDTLDEIAGHLISDLVRRHRQFEARLIEWADDDNFWVRRAALLAQLKQKAETNTELLAQIILKLAPEKEFFIRKAIGWVLRDYSYTDPDWVRQFVEQHADKLSGLSQREALKQVKRHQS